MITWRQTVFVMGIASVAGAQTDPRVGLGGGHYVEAADASSNMQLIAHKDRPKPFFNPNDPGDFYVINSDLAFHENLVFQGNFYGIQIWDVADIRNPVLKTSLVCPGGQGDPSVYGNLMFMSVEMPNGRVDCGTESPKDTVSPDRFRGVRVFDISDVAHPKQIAAVQTCRGSHTHTLIPDPKDKNVLWIYVQGTAPSRPAGELAGCSGAQPEQDPNTSLFRIDIIKVPLDHPQDAKVVAGPRIFALNGQINGLWKGGKHGDGTQETSTTDQCHDITAYPAIGLAAGACSGNGILLDITNPGEPKRVAEVSDPNFAYFHSATFSNDGKKVIFTDEWGGGVAPRCRASDPKNWGADAIFSIGADHKLTLDGYYKLPAPQTETENCVAHNGSLVPVPGRDILAQGWYQGGVSIYDFTDPAHAQEIAYFDRGPLDTKTLYIAGDWAAYWYNGYVYGSEIARGLDIFELQPSQYLSKNEIDAAKLVKIGTSNPSDQPKIVWPAAFVVARAYLDQLERMNGLGTDRIAAIRGDLDKAEQMSGAQQKSALQKLAKQTEGDAKNAKDAERVHWLTGTIKGLAGEKTGNGG
ncbi:MAG TPA: hypothetical protein VK807_07460 [Gemmatimonadaceae bacterium]|nr:hypothetical protein [Gemmatimonadaceae bacterium]